MALKQTDQQLIPSQVTGTKTDNIERIKLHDSHQAEELYATARQKLLDVNAWGKVSGLPLSSFKLHNSSANPANRFIKHGDYIRIDIPGPGTRVGIGFDWVKVEKIQDKPFSEGECLSIRVRPCYHPLDPGGRVAHFLNDCTTYTFQVRRVGNTVYAAKHARNEKINMAAGNCLDNLRNLFVGIVAKVGFSYPKWKNLLVGLIR
jgi:hypothetical protein